MYAIGLQENRVFAIYQDVNIKVLPYSKEEYLNKKHKYYESHKLHKKVITESHIGQGGKRNIETILTIIEITTFKTKVVIIFISA